MRKNKLITRQRKRKLIPLFGCIVPYFCSRITLFTFQATMGQHKKAYTLLFHSSKNSIMCSRSSIPLSQEHVFSGLTFAGNTSLAEAR